MILRTFVLFLLFISFQVVFSEEDTLLKQEDIKKVMNQIFSQHVEKKQISGNILKNSFRVYIDQFDPQRLYLLEGEVTPFIDMNDQTLQQLVKDYLRGDYSIYEKLNSVIQKSILRAQKNRQTWIAQGSVEKPFLSFQSYPNFATSLTELQNRQKQAIARYLKDNSQTTQLAVLKEYDRNRKNFENQYLFLDLKGNPLAKNQTEHLLTMHSIKALAKSLDAHTSFLNPNEAYDMRVRLEKSFDGIGILLNQTPQGFQIAKIIPGSSAEADGRLAVNDFLIKINDQVLQNQSLNEVNQMLRGKNGSTVALQVKRIDPIHFNRSPQIFNLILTRENITVNEGRAETSAMNYQDGLIGVIKLQSFYQGANDISSEEDVKKSIEALRKKGKLKGLVLDLRENSGGFLTQAVKVAGLFITNGVIVISKYSNGEEKFYRDMDGKTSYQGPLIVLTSRVTASAAEIVAQALQDYGVALVVGDEHTYGKGTIQSQTVTDEGSDNSYFKVTVGKYYTVSGKTPQIHGVRADIVVPSPHSLEHIGEEYLDYPINQDFIPNSFVDNLNDIDPGLKPWYLRYYMPTLQKPDSGFKEMVPILKKRSSNRIQKNSNYATFLEKDPDINSANRVLMRDININDPQLHETINILKDLIQLQKNPSSQSKHQLGVVSTVD